MAASPASIVSGTSPLPCSTVVVAGAPRGGTTMMVAMLSALGVSFGDKLNEKGEDFDVMELVRRLGRWPNPTMVAPVRDGLARLARLRVAEWGLWGVKYPHITPWLPALADAFPSPRFVVVTRGIAAVTHSNRRRAGTAAPHALWRAVGHRVALERFARSRGDAAAVFRFEDLVADPSPHTVRLSRFIGLNAPQEVLDRAAGTVRYDGRYAPVRRLAGFVEHVDAREVRGWVCDRHNPGRPLKVEAWLGAKKLAETTADGFRPDVADHSNHSNGQCGFVLPLPRAMTDAEQGALSVCVPTVGHRLSARIVPGHPAVRQGPSDLEMTPAPGPDN